jgi:hypothetical protein
MLEKLKPYLYMIGMILLIVLAAKMTQPTGSYSGSMHELNESGVVLIADGNLTYVSNNGQTLTKTELRALAKLSDRYQTISIK